MRTLKRKICDAMPCRPSPFLRPAVQRSAADAPFFPGAGGPATGEPEGGREEGSPHRRAQDHRGESRRAQAAQGLVRAEVGTFEVYVLGRGEPREQSSDADLSGAEPRYGGSRLFSRSPNAGGVVRRQRRQAARLDPILADRRLQIYAARAGKVRLRVLGRFHGGRLPRAVAEAVPAFSPYGCDLRIGLSLRSGRQGLLAHGRQVRPGLLRWRAESRRQDVYGSQSLSAPASGNAAW